jgi:hypothetical protein
MLEDKEQKIARPRQIYAGSPCRNFVPLAERKQGAANGTSGLSEATVATVQR